MLQQENDISLQIQRYSLSFSKPQPDLVIALQQLPADQYQPLINLIGEHLNPFTQSRKIYNLLKVLVWGKKSIEIFQQSEPLQKQLTELLFNSFGAGLYKNSNVTKDRVRMMKVLRVLGGNQIYEVFTGSSIKKDCKYANLGAASIDYKNSKDQDALKKVLSDKLKEEYFVDLKNRPINGLRFNPIFVQSGLLSDEDIVIYLEQAEKLLKRSSTNIEILVQFFEELSNTNVDLSFYIPNLLDMLKESISATTNYENGLRCLQLTFGQVKDPKVHKTLFAFIQKGIYATNDEVKKISFLTLLTGVGKTLKYIKSNEDKQQIQMEFILLISDNLSIITKDEQLLPFLQLLTDLFQDGADQFTIPNQYIPAFKKTSGQNKISAAFINSLFLHYIKAKKETISEIANFNDLVEAIFNFSVAPNLTNFSKTVSQPLMFFSGLNFILLYLHYCEEDAPQKLLYNINKVINPQIKFQKQIQAKHLEVFNIKSHFSRLPYITSMSQQESQLLGECLLLLYSVYFDEFSEQSHKYKVSYFGTLLTVVAFSNKTRNHFDLTRINQTILEILKKNDNGVTQFYGDIFYSLRWYLYTIDPYKQVDLTFRKDRLNQFAFTLVSMLIQTIHIENVAENQEERQLNAFQILQHIRNLDLVFFSLSHQFLSQQWLHQLLNVLRKLNITQPVLKLILKEKSTSPYFWISEYGFVSQNRFTEVSIVNYCTFLVNLGAQKELIDCFSPIFDSSNIPDVSSLDVVKEEMSVFIEKFKKEDDIQADQLLIQMGIDTFTNTPPEDQQESELKQQLLKSKGNRKGDSLQLMDENEAKQSCIRQHKAKIISVFNLMAKYLVCFNKTDQRESLEWFYANFHENLVSLTQLKENRLPYLRVVLPFFRRNKITEKYAFEITQFFIQKATKEANLSQPTLQKILKFQQSIEKSQEIKSISIINLIKQMQLYVLQVNDFELKYKQSAMRFALNYSQVSTYFAENLLPEYYPVIVKNINICAHLNEAFDLLTIILQKNSDKQQQFVQLFENILNLVEEAKILVLRCLQTVDPKTLPLEIDLAVKLRVLLQTGNQSITDLATGLIEKLPEFSNYCGSLKSFDYEDYVLRNAREHLEVTTRIFYDSLKTPDDWKILSFKVIQAASSLETKLDVEQLLFLPTFVNVCVDKIPQDYLPQFLDLLIGKYAAKESRTHLVQSSIEAGIVLVKHWGQTSHQTILPVIEKYMKSQKIKIQSSQPAQQKEKPSQQEKQTLKQFEDEQSSKDTFSSSSICSVIFLGVLTPHLQNSKEILVSIQQQILQLFRTRTQETQVSLAKCLGDLLPFFPNPQSTILEIIANNKQEVDVNSRRGKAYLLAGLIRGLGVQTLENLRIFELLDEQSGAKKEALESQQSNLLIIQAIVDILGRLVEPYIVQIFAILMKYFGDGKEEVRSISINATRILMQRLTGYGVKIILPHLFKGIGEAKAWRGKIATIWALGNMAYCSPKQLSSCLPEIVKCISSAISDTHHKVRDSANESLELIGSTIQNPEISNIADILIKSLSSPFDENKRGMEVLLCTNFIHYIDAPALSLLIPIIDYGLRSQDSEQKVLASKLVGSLPHLIKHPDDLIPYMEMLLGGLEVALADPLFEVRSITAQSIGRLSKKIGYENSEKFFNFVVRILDTPEIPNIKRSGAANAMAEIMTNQDMAYFETQLQKIMEVIQKSEVQIKEGYVGIFTYIPGILGRKFEPYVKDLLDNIIELVSHEEDIVKNMTLKVLKIIIQKYTQSLNQLLYPVLNEGMINEYWKRRNASVILSGEMLEISRPLRRTQLEDPKSPQYIDIELYTQNIMLLYIMRQDDAEMVRNNATNIWKSYIDNTPREVKTGLRYLVRALTSIMSKPRLHVVGINTIINFCQKYGESHLREVLDYVKDILEQNHITKENNQSLTPLKGSYAFLTHLYKYVDNDALNKQLDLVLEISRMFIESKEKEVKEYLFQSVGTFVNKLKNTEFLESLIDPYIESIQTVSDCSEEYITYLDIFDHLCSLNSQIILAYLVKLLLVEDIEPYQIDILTNNSRTFAKVVYQKSHSIIPMDILLSELYSKNEEYRLDHSGNIEWGKDTQSLIYCIGQISIQLAEVEDHIAYFIKDILNRIELYSTSILEDRNDDFNKLVISIEILQYFLHNSSEQFQEHSKQILPRIVPYLFLKNKSLNKEQHYILIELSNKIINNINNTIEKEVHHENLNILQTCFFNRIQSTSFSKEIPGLNQSEGLGVQPYVDMIINSLVYGLEGENTFDTAIEFLQILLTYTDTEYLQIYILKIIGALIRVLNYKLNNTQKMQGLKILLQVNQKKLQLTQFTSQLSITYSKLVMQIHENSDGLKLLSQNYSYLFLTHPKKDLHLNELFQRAIQTNMDVEESIQRECLLKLLKKILKDNSKLFSRALLERVFQLTRQLFDKLLAHHQLGIYETQQIGSILGILFTYANQVAKNQFKEKYLSLLEQSVTSTILASSFYRYNTQDFDAAQVYDILTKLIRSSSENLVISQCLKDINKFKKENVNPFSQVVAFETLVNDKTIQTSDLVRITLLKLK